MPEVWTYYSILDKSINRHWIWIGSVSLGCEWLRYETLTRIGWLLLTCICMMNFLCWMCSLYCCTCENYTLKGTFSNKSNLINYQWVTSRNYTQQLYQHIMLCITFAWLSCCCCLSTATLLLLIAWFHETILIVLSFTHDGALIKEESPYRKPNAKTFQKMVGKECGLILSSHLWGEALCDDTTC